MLSQKNRNFALVLVGLFLIIVIWAFNVNKPMSSNLVQPNNPAVSPNTGLSGTPRLSPKALKYENALQQFAGRVVQFDELCQAHPANMTVKNGTAVMFDNRSGDARWFTLNGSGYHLKGYSYTVVTLSGKKLPLNLVIDCGSAKNVGQILIQR